jgi:hypothetical protein
MEDLQWADRGTLDFLLAAEVQLLLGELAQRDVSASTAQLLHDQTDANPLFVQEIVRDLIEHGAGGRTANSLTVVARHLSGAMALLGDHRQAVRYAEQALAVGDEIRFRPEQALARLQLAELLSTAPDRSVVGELESMHMRPALARARSLTG